MIFIMRLENMNKRWEVPAKEAGQHKLVYPDTYFYSRIDPSNVNEKISAIQKKNIVVS